MLSQINQCIQTMGKFEKQIHFIELFSSWFLEKVRKLDKTRLKKI